MTIFLTCILILLLFYIGFLLGMGFAHYKMFTGISESIKRFENTLNKKQAQPKYEKINPIKPNQNFNYFSNN